MAVTLMQCEVSDGSPDDFSGGHSCEQLRPGEEAEALEFLARRPIHTVFMATLIRDNGSISPNNRGSFYACRDAEGKLAGVALIGHATIVEASTDEAVAAFAQLAAHSQHAHLIRGERTTVESFWKHYSEAGVELRLICREMLFEKRSSPPVAFDDIDIRPARMSELEQVLAINALLAFEQARVNPLQRDPKGFRARTARRIEQGRVWIATLDGEPVFKADAVGDTPEMIYLEGIHVDSRRRGKGYGKRCLKQLSSILLARSRSICLTINQRNADTVAFYVKAGFDFHSEYLSLYLR